MNFYTKDWKEYAYEKWEIGLPIKFFITQEEFLYDDRKLKSLVDYKNLINAEYAKFCNNRKKYINSYDELKNKLTKYEIVNIPNNLEEEYKNYFVKVENKAKEIKEKLLKNIDELKINNINFNLVLEDEDFTLIALNKVTLKIKMFYEELKEKLCMIGKYDYMFDYIYNDINAFLTSYDEYLNSRKDKFDFDLLNNIEFYGASILKYIKNNTDVYLEIFDETNDKIIKMELKNCFLNCDVDLKNSYICGCIYANYEDYKFYLGFDLYNKDRFIEFVADTIVVDVVDNE